MDEKACKGGCYWIAPNICSRCEEKARTDGSIPTQEKLSKRNKKFKIFLNQISNFNI